MDLNERLQTGTPVNRTPLSSANTVEPAADAHRLERQLFTLLAVVALIYAFISGLRTVADPDFFWQLSTGRWVAQHHHVFSTDVFSYTAFGQPWIYPVGSGLIFYATYLAGGYVLLSWLGAATCVGTVAVLLRRNSAGAATIAIVAVPLIARRINPRADMFTVILFAVFLSLLWENYQTGRARLWPLPVLMLAWVNLHLGFVSGLGLMAAFAGLDVLQMLRGGERRQEAVQRLRRALPWFGATALATVLNPWGWNIYAALVRQNRAMAEHTNWIAEWGKMPFSWSALLHAFSATHPETFYVLLVIVAVAVLAALLQGEVGAAILLVGATYEGIQHLRMEALTACVVVVVGGSVLATALRYAAVWISSVRIRTVLAVTASLTIAGLGFYWCADSLKLNEIALSSFGGGLSWWFPERATEFVRQANVPGEIFNTYNEGGYLTWALGPKYRDYIDGRAIPFGPGAFLREAELMQSSPDSAEWQTEADRYNIHAIILPLDRFESEIGYLKYLCNSTVWKPIYLDEISAVFVRNTPETADLIRRSQMNCATAALPAAAPDGSSAARFNAWTNAATVLATLGRNPEALAAADKAAEILPESSFVPWLRGNVDYAMGNHYDAEREYRKAIAINPEIPLFWFSLAAVYKHQDRIPETIAAQRKAIELSTMPKPYELLKLARLYLDTKQPKEALEVFDEAVRVSSPDLRSGSEEHNVQFQADQGRAEAWRALGNAKKAAQFDQEAVQDLVPRS
jgi:tetratricopeptide (TPR) repeat protein